MSSKSPDLAGRLLKGRYRVESALAEGGMGAVYLATDEDLKRRVVVKVPKVELLADAEFRARFEREMRSLIGLDHPCVVKLLDAGEDDGVPYVVLQHLAGGDLNDRITASESPLTCEGVLEWLPSVARALDFIHRPEVGEDVQEIISPNGERD